MPEVKILFSEESDYEDSYAFKCMVDQTDWETITDEELAFLRLHKRHIFRKENERGLYACIIVKDEISINDRIKSVKALVAKEQKRRDEEKRLAEQKAAERRAKAAERKEKKKREEFERLKKEFGE